MKSNKIEQIKKLEVAKLQAAHAGNFQMFSAICQDIRTLQAELREEGSEYEQR